MIRITLPQYQWFYDPSTPLGKPGGFGQVFLGTDETKHMEVAIKQLNMTADDAGHRELDIAEKLGEGIFSHIMPILDSGEDAETGGYFIVMPKAETDLRSKLELAGKFDEQEATSILLQIALGLAEVSEVVHRDLKPDNILWHENVWKVADFGIARFVENATSLRTLKDALTPHYAAPEQWKLERATNATDVYALGCMAYELLTGTPPFNGPQRDDFRDQHLHETPARLTVNDKLRNCVNMMLRKNASVRPSLNRVIELLEQLLSDPPQDQRADSAISILAKASADEEEARLQRDAEIASLEQEKEDRNSVAKEAKEILQDILAILVEKVEGAAPNVRFNPTSGTKYLSVTFGDAQLDVELLNRGRVISKSEFPESGWDVIVGAVINVTQGKPKPYTWSANLWFTNMGKGNDFRWYEVPYFHFRHNRPVALTDLAKADLAASPITDYISISYKTALSDRYG